MEDVIVDTEGHPRVTDDYDSKYQNTCLNSFGEKLLENVKPQILRILKIFLAVISLPRDALLKPEIILTVPDLKQKEPSGHQLMRFLALKVQ